MISSKMISVVVQGPIHHQENLTKRVLESVRKHLPDAELILSTWKGSDTSGLDCDILLLNDDPGSVDGSNVNRQIVSTRNGLQKATRHYAVKLRTDTLLTGTGFLDAFDRYPERRDDFKVFEHKVVIPTLYTRNPRRSYLFHPSDMFQFGLRSDLLDLWDMGLFRSLYYSLDEPHPAFKSPSEQIIWLSYLNKKKIKVDFNLNALSPFLAFVSEVSLINNFIVQSPQNLDIVLPSRFNGFSGPDLCYTEKEWQKVHRHYCILRKSYLDIKSRIYFSIKFYIAKQSLSFPKLSAFLHSIGLKQMYSKILRIVS